MSILSFSHKFVFIHLHKCGGSSVEASYEMYASPGDIVLGGASGDNRTALEFSGRTGLHKHSSAAEFASFLGSDANQYEFISMVRHPLERQKSLFKWVKRGIAEWASDLDISFDEALLLLRSGTLQPEFLRWEPFQIFLGMHDVTSFEQFSDAAYEYMPSWYPRRDPALCPMSESLYGVVMSKVFKLEYIDELWKWLSMRVGASVVHSNVNASDSNLQSKLGNILKFEISREVLIRHVRSFREDYLRFGYDTNI